MMTRREAQALYSDCPHALAAALGVDVTTIHHFKLDGILPSRHLLRLALVWPVETAASVAVLRQEAVDAHTEAVAEVYKRGKVFNPPQKVLL